MSNTRHLRTTPVYFRSSPPNRFAIVNGYYEYSSPILHHARVSVTPTRDPLEMPTSANDVQDMGNGHTSGVIHSSSTDEISSSQHSKQPLSKDIASWSSHDVKRWIKQQCKKFELKKATVEKFEMNGQAFLMLSKHDFLRRSPDGGEVLYYALQRLINPNKENTARLDQSLVRNGSTRRCRIVELDSDAEEELDSASAKPIIQEPDDPVPPLRKSRTSSATNNGSATNFPSYQEHPFLNANNIRQPFYVVPPNVAYYHQHMHPHAYLYHQQRYAHPQFYTQNAAQGAHFTQQPMYHPMMSSYAGIFVEEIENPAGAAAEPSMYAEAASQQLYLVTVNGQQYVMNEEKVRRFVQEIQIAQAQQQQAYHAQQQQQQQQQHFHNHQQAAQPQPPPPSSQQAPPSDNAYYTL